MQDQNADATPNPNPGTMVEKKLNGKPGKGKRMPQRAGKRKTPLNAWYNGCKFYCPKDKECKYEGFPHKDSLTKHWKSFHGGSARNLHEDSRNVIKQYQCKMCLKSVSHIRDFIYRHLRANHTMSVADYEKRFHHQKRDLITIESVMATC